MSEDLSDLLHDAVAGVEPAERLPAIRERARRPARHRRRAVLGAVLVTAAVVATAAFVGRSDPGDGPSPAARPSDPATPGAGAVAVYYAGETPHGPRLFREFHPGTPGLDEALDALSTPPEDPDYATFWLPGQLLSASVAEGTILVEVNPALTGSRPDGRFADLGFQQVVYTLQAALGRRLPVLFVHDGAAVAEVRGLPTGGPIGAAPQLDVLAQVSISNPAEGRVVEGHFTADGVASSFEGTVRWELREADGTVVDRGFTSGDFDPARLTPWATGDIDVSGLPPGRYSFAALTDDPSDGEGPGPTIDTRTITVR